MRDWTREQLEQAYRDACLEAEVLLAECENERAEVARLREEAVQLRAVRISVLDPYHGWGRNTVGEAERFCELHTLADDTYTDEAKDLREEAARLREVVKAAKAAEILTSYGDGRNARSVCQDLRTCGITVYRMSDAKPAVRKRLRTALAYLAATDAGKGGA